MSKWAYLATAPNQVVAEMWKDMLVQEGIPAMLHPEDIQSFLSISAKPVRVLVAEDKLETAQALIDEWEKEESSDSEGEEVEEEASEDAEFRGR